MACHYLPNRVIWRRRNANSLRTNDARTQKLLRNFGHWNNSFTMPSFHCRVRKKIKFLQSFHFWCVFFRASISSYGGDHQNTSAARSRGYHIPSKNVQVITIQDKETLQRFANATAQNVTFLLDHLLQQYDNSLRPDISGRYRINIKGKWFRSGSWNWYVCRSSFGGRNQYAGAKYGPHFRGRHGECVKLQ